MQDFLYSIVGVIALIVHLIINPNMFKREKKQSAAARSYQLLMISIFAYYITDACWGLFAGLNNIPVLFVDTTLYYVAMGSAVYCWAAYIVDYLNTADLFGKTVKLFALIFIFAELGFLAVNFFYPCFFWFDVNDSYQAGMIRYAFLIIQVVLFFLTVLITGRNALQSEGALHSRNGAVFFFSVVMMVAAFFQVLYPLLPIYAMGCLVGSCILHVYVVEDEREEYRQLIAEERDIAEQASLAKTSFLFNMSHDIRTPMNAILGYTAMARKYSADPQVSDYLGKIDVAGNQLLSLVNQVLEMSRIESGTIVLQEQKIVVEEGTEIVRTVYADQARSRGLSFTAEYGDIRHPHLIGDADRLTQIMNNLLGNAMKYTPEGGSVLFRVEELESGDPDRALMRFTVSDNGIGMSEEFLPHLFEEFSREQSSTVSHIQGTGLGMSIVHKLTALMGGTIEVDSAPEKGTTFRVTVPLLIDSAPAPVQIVEEENEESLAGMKILLVDDNEMNREIAEEILTDFEAEVDSVEDGDLAVERLRVAPAGTYDLVLMDIQMPRMNGYEATRLIRAFPDPARAGIRIIAMTANAFEEDRRAALEAGMDGHLAKPIDVPKLLETLSRYRRNR